MLVHVALVALFYKVHFPFLAAAAAAEHLGFFALDWVIVSVAVLVVRLVDGVVWMVVWAHSQQQPKQQTLFQPGVSSFALSSIHPHSRL